MADLGLYENYLEHARINESILYRRRTVALRKMELAFEIPDPEFIGLYRLNKSVCCDLIQELEPYLCTRRSGISTISKVLSALSFFASGSYQRYIGASAHHKMHQVSVSKCVRAVTLALNNDHFRGKYIHFPQTREERSTIKNGFYRKYKMPGVLGCVDGTHIAIVRPAEHEERFLNRKRNHSLNAQIVCDSDLNILSIDASHGGANHDSFIWNHHPLKFHLEQLHQSENERVWFLGDSGYPLRSTLMIPVVDTEPSSPQRYYTEVHSRVRNTVERCIGVLSLVGGAYWWIGHPTMAGYITNACVVLHNVANTARLPVMALTPQEELNETNMQMVNSQIDTTASIRNRPLDAGESMRNDLIHRLWTTRLN